MQVTIVPCLSDNYAYLVHADGDKRAFVVDPSEAAPVIAAIEREGLELVGIVNTHHHIDHVGGNEELVQRYGKLDVVAFEGDKGRVPKQTKGVVHGGEFDLAHLHVKALHVPGHTTGAVSYLVDGAVFTGDTLFISGCGRLFEGSAADMNTSLNEKLAALPPETRVYCGHEYTVNNLRFAAEVDPDNEAIRAALEEAKAKRERGEPTVPSTLGRELATNPFMRVREDALKKRYGGDAPAQVLGAVRAAKDGWKG
jgi:hydroxyacylglutathione hydrolase